MDLIRKKNAVLRPVTKRGVDSPHIINNFRTTKDNKLSNHLLYQISFIPTGSTYIQMLPIQSRKKDQIRSSKVSKMFPIQPIQQAPYSPTIRKKIKNVENNIVDFNSPKKVKEEQQQIEKKAGKLIEQTSNLNDLQIQRILGELTQQNPKNIKKKALYQKLQKVMGYFQSQILAKTLNKLLVKQLLFQQAKIYICSQNLLNGLGIVKIYAKGQYQDQNPFEIINQMNKGILQYLMSKYPRSKNLFVEHQLQSQFDNISFLTRHQNNVFVNCNYTFTEKNLTRIDKLDRTKIFLNKLLSQLDNKFPSFSKVMNQKILKLEGQKINEKLNKIKIGRKIPQNTEKYYEFGNQLLEIHSPQLFRVMIKWIQSLQQLLTSPSDMINKRSSIKYIKKNLGIGKIVFDQIQSKRFEQMKIDIIEKINSQTQWKQEINQLLDKLNQFNKNLINTLAVRSPKMKFISQDQAETLKFAKFNTLFLQWLIIEKFLILIDALCNLSSYFETKYFKKLDLINFNVYDLMRASFSGKKNQIIQVFKNMHRLQDLGQLTILRVKNRLNTPLNDVLINFMIKDSFLICQLQLVLVQNLQEGEQKLKMMEFLNHIIYQLYRTPYGSISQMALIVGYYDPTIIYEKKITFQKNWFKNQGCIKGNHHQFIQMNDQTTPFVCSWCVNFYGRQENFFEYNQCIHCSLQKCKACVFQEDPFQQKRVYYKYFASCFLKIPLQQLQNDKDDDFIDNFFIRDETSFFNDKFLKLRDQLHIQAKQTKLQAIQGILHRKQKQYGLKATQPFYSLLLRFQSGNHHLKIIKYCNFKIQICTQDTSQEVQKKFRVQKYDALFFLRKRVYRNPKSQSNTYIDSVPSEDIKSLKRITDGTKVKYRKKGFNIVYLQHMKQNYLIDWEKSATKLAEPDRQKIDMVLNKIINKCTSYKAERTCVQLQNLGLNFEIMEPITSKEWARQVKVLNLTNNQIQNIPDIFKCFTNLHEAYLSKNAITSIQISSTQKFKIKVLDLSRNQITQIPQQINLLGSLIILKAQNNLINKISKLKLENLEQLHLNQNKLTNLDNLKDSYLPEIQILNISLNKFNAQNPSVDILSTFSNLRKLQAKKINLIIQQNSQLDINCFKKLQYLDLSSNKLVTLKSFKEKHLREIKMAFCGIISLNKVFTDNLIHLQNLKLNNNQIKEFPLLQLPELLYLDLSSNGIKFISNISQSYLAKLQILHFHFNQIQDIQQLSKIELPNLQELYLNKNEIKTLPSLNFPSLRTLNLVDNNLQDINKLTHSLIPNLKRLLIKNNKIRILPQIQFHNLEEFNPCQNNINDLSCFKDSILPKLHRIALWQNQIIKVPNLQMPTAQELLLFSNRISDMSGLSSSTLNSVKIISLYNNRLKCLEVISLDNLQKFYAYKNKIEDISALKHWNTPKLQVLDLNSNKINKISALNLPSLHELQLSQNQIQDIDEFMLSDLPGLRKLFMNNNKIHNLGKFENFSKIQDMQFNNCQIQTIQKFCQCQLKELKKLSIQNNKISLIPNLSQFISLQQLYVRGNKIQSISAPFKFNKKLRRFWATNNCIQALKQQIYQQSAIQQISLSRNPLNEFQGLQTLKLKSLTMNNCNIKSLDGFFAPRLSELLLKDNKITDLNFINEPGAFISLKRLIIQKNNIKMVPALDLPMIGELSLKNNPIQCIDEILKSTLPKIRKIFISSHSIKSYPLINRTSSMIKMDQNEAEDSSQQSNQSKSEQKQQASTSLAKAVKSDFPGFDKKRFLQEFTKIFPNCIIKL